MKYVFLGTIVNDDLKNKLTFLGARQEPGDLVQKYILNELNKSVDSLFVISSPRIQNWPECKVKKVPSTDLRLDTIRGLTSGFSNMLLLSRFSRTKQFVKTCKRWAKCNSNEEVRIIVYSLNSTFLQGAMAIRKIVRETAICVIVPDLPIFMGTYKWPVSLLKKIDIKRIDKMRKIVDFYALYSEQMASYLCLHKDKYIVTEGFIDKKKINLGKKCNEHKKRICVYAGDLHSIYGIQNLIDAFDEIGVECELDLYGDYKLASQYKYNKNVKFKGLVTPDEAFEIMKNADLLINPRPSSLELTKYSVPSKTFEYMASGTPCVMCKLPGIPDEYFDYVYVFADESVVGLKTTIESILNKSQIELHKVGRYSAQFLLENKTAEKHVITIIEMFNKIKPTKGDTTSAHISID